MNLEVFDIPGESTAERHRRRALIRAQWLRDRASVAQQYYSTSKRGRQHIEAWQRYCDQHADTLLAGIAGAPTPSATDATPTADAVERWLDDIWYK